MKIGVCLKQVPDTETKIRLNDQKNWISEEGVKFVVNPYDEFALEEALKARDKFQGEVVTVTIGPKRSQEAIRSALAMGANRAVHVVVEDHKLDPLAVAAILKEVIAKEGFEVVFMGKQAIDNDHAQIGLITSEMLDWPSANVVTRLEFSPDGKSMTVEREVEGGARDVIELKLPAVITATKGLNTPRYPSLKGIMDAKKKEIKEISVDSLGLGADKLSAKIALENLRLPAERKAGRMIAGEPKDAAKALVDALRNEAKVL